VQKSQRVKIFTDSAKIFNQNNSLEAKITVNQVNGKTESEKLSSILKPQSNTLPKISHKSHINPP